ncbi:ABC transporter permease [Allostreptomyces psammosilenae]|nr:ABC transporter permease [Allostreptomyces psammosilenae]
MVLAQALLETRILLRNPEQLLLTIVIPVLLLAVFSTVDIVDLDTGDGQRPVDYLTPGVLALAVMSTAFTGQAIATGFERRYGVLKRLGASPLPRSGLMAAKTLSVLAVELAQLVLLVVVALLLDWRPAGDGGASGVETAVAVVALIALGTAAFSGLGLLMAGTLRAEATLGAANLVFILLLLVGGVVVPLDRFGGAEPVLELLPIAALSEGLRAVLQDGAGLPWGHLGVLAVWTLLGTAAAARFFRWE